MVVGSATLIMMHGLRGSFRTGPPLKPCIPNEEPKCRIEFSPICPYHRGWDWEYAYYPYS